MEVVDDQSDRWLLDHRRRLALCEAADVSLSIDAGNTPDQSRSLSVRGRAEVTIVDGPVPEYVAAARETMDAEAAAEFERACREM